MKGRGAKLVALALKDKNETVSTAANINDLVPLVTYNFELANKNDQTVDNQPCNFIQELEAELSPLQNALPLTSGTSLSLTQNQTINHTLHTDTDDVSYEIKINNDLIYDNIDIMLLPELETQLPSVQSNLLEKSIDVTALSANYDINTKTLTNESDNNMQTDQTESDLDYGPLPDVDVRNDNNNTHVIASHNNMQTDQNEFDLDKSDVNDPDYVPLQDAHKDGPEKIPLKKRKKVADRNCWDKYVNQKKRTYNCNNMQTDQTESDLDYGPLPDVDVRNDNNNTHVIASHNNMQTDQNEFDLDKSDVNDPDYVPLQDAHKDGPEKIPLKKRKKVADRNCWDKYVNQKKRMNGKEYIGYTRQDGVVNHNIKRNQRQMGPKCESTFCKRASNRHCNLFTDEIRRAIFEKFWAIDWEQKRLYIVHMANYLEKHRSYVSTPSRRTGSFEYYLKHETGKFRVCKQTFLGTLGIKEKMVVNWVNEGKKFGLLVSKEKRNEETKQKKRTFKLFTDTQEKKEHLQRFLNELPKMESHYCRQNTDKLYLEEDFKSKAEVYTVYKEKCLADSVTPLSSFSFCRELEHMNIGLFKPRKDQCDLCFAYKIKQLEECVYQEHIKAKEAARNEKDVDKKKAQEDLIHCFTMDAQAVKLCPKLEVSTAYYKTKLQVHNFTIYNLKTHQSKNFLWNESEGELCSSVFATCIVKHLESFLNIKVQPIVLWSDSCGYQNKNNILSNALSLLATKYSVTIEQKYLEKGHTQMECDSTHSLIERRLKRKDIFLPTDYINIIKEARKKPFPLDVEYLSHSYFLNFEDPKCKRYNSIRPGNKKNDLKVNNLRCLKYESSGEILYKSAFIDSYVLLPQRQKTVDLNYVPKPLYQERLKIKKVKWTHLQEFKSVLPGDVHFFYDALQYYEEKKNMKECEKPKNVEEDPDKMSDSESPKVAVINVKMDHAKKLRLNSKTERNQRSEKNSKKKPHECRKSTRNRK